MPAELYLRCQCCRRLSAFEQPPCADGHGDDCPERVCVRCGTAVLLGATVPAGRRSAAEHRAA